jgi:hypothetical protein
MSPKVWIQVLQAEFRYGVLLIADAESKEDIPSWESAEEQVAVAASALVVRVQHADEGEVTVRVCNSLADAAGGLIFTGEIEVPSGVLRVSDALGTSTADVKVEPGLLAIQIYADSHVEASALHLVLT